MGLDQNISRSGLFKFKDYHTKLRMMSTQMFLFGMKMHRQEGSIEFFDPDFSNALQI